MTVYIISLTSCGNATQRNTTQRNATQRNATQRNATQRNATQRNATQRNATQRNATQRNATQRNATQRDATICRIQGLVVRMTVAIAGMKDINVDISAFRRNAGICCNMW